MQLRDIEDWEQLHQWERIELLRDVLRLEGATELIEDLLDVERRIEDAYDDGIHGA